MESKEQLSVIWRCDVNTVQIGYAQPQILVNVGKKGHFDNWACRDLLGCPVNPQTPALLSENTGGMLEHLYGHQGSLARTLEASRAVYSTTESSRRRSLGDGQNPDPGPKKGYPRVISSSMAPWSSRQSARPRSIAPAEPDAQNTMRPIRGQHASVL